MWYNAFVAYILIIIIIIAKATTAAFDYPDDYHIIGILESLFSHKCSCQIGHLYFEWVLKAFRNVIYKKHQYLLFYMHNTYIQIMAIPIFPTHPYLLCGAIVVYVCGRHNWRIKIQLYERVFAY